MLDDDIRIVSVNEDNSFNADTGERKAIIRVTFRVGAHGPFVERFAKTDYSAATRDATLNTFAREVR